jgi:hypothetical protein
LISKETIHVESMSGLVIAGFGARDHFPVMIEYEIGGMYDGKLKYRIKTTERISTKQPGMVRAFADSSMVDTFLHGVTPEYLGSLFEILIQEVLHMTAEIVDGVPDWDPDERKRYKQKTLDAVGEEVIQPLYDRFKALRGEQELPVEEAVAFMPKNELAHVATSLVTLNAFKKRMSTREDETVGGPVDVAVISKGDGFVWINRKYYFPRDLNHHYFRNYGQPTKKPKGDDHA